MTKESISELQHSLLKAIGDKLAPYGFRTDLSNQSYRRDFDGGRSSFHIGFIEHEADFDCTADVAIRFDKVEDLVNEDNKILTKKERRETHTLGAELGNLRNKKQQRWAIANERDIAPTVEQIIRAYTQTAALYFDEYTDPTRALSVLSRDEKDAWLHCPIHVGRAKRAIALSVVLGADKSSIKAIANEKIRFLQEANDPSLAVFRNFLKRLRLE